MLRLSNLFRLYLLLYFDLLLILVAAAVFGLWCSGYWRWWRWWLANFGWRVRLKFLADAVDVFGDGNYMRRGISWVVVARNLKYKKLVKWCVFESFVVVRGSRVQHCLDGGYSPFSVGRFCGGVCHMRLHLWRSCISSSEIKSKSWLSLHVFWNL